MAEPLFSVRGLKVALPDMTRKPLIGRAPLAEILKGLDFDLPRGSVTGIVGESGSGKIDARPRPGAPAGAQRRQHQLRRPRHHPSAGSGAAAPASQPADDLPGPDVVAQSAPHHCQHHRRAAQAERPWRQSEGARRRGACSASACRKVSPAATATNCRAASASASALRVRWRCRLNSCWPTRSSPASTCRRRRRSSPFWRNCAAEMGLTVAFISHDLSVIRRLCRQVIVMREGVIVEASATDALFENPQQSLHARPDLSHSAARNRCRLAGHPCGRQGADMNAYARRNAGLDVQPANDQDPPMEED